LYQPHELDDRILLALDLHAHLELAALADAVGESVAKVRVRLMALCDEKRVHATPFGSFRLTNEERTRVHDHTTSTPEHYNCPDECEACTDSVNALVRAAREKREKGQPITVPILPTNAEDEQVVDEMLEEHRKTSATPDASIVAVHDEIVRTAREKVARQEREQTSAATTATDQTVARKPGEDLAVTTLSAERSGSEPATGMTESAAGSGVVGLRAEFQPKCRHCMHWESRMCGSDGHEVGWCLLHSAEREHHESHRCHTELLAERSEPTDAELDAIADEAEQDFEEIPGECPDLAVLRAEHAASAWEETEDEEPEIHSPTCDSNFKDGQCDCGAEENDIPDGNADWDELDEPKGREQVEDCESRRVGPTCGDCARFRPHERNRRMGFCSAYGIGACRDTTAVMRVAGGEERILCPHFAPAENADETGESSTSDTERPPTAESPPQHVCGSDRRPTNGLRIEQVAREFVALEKRIQELDERRGLLLAELRGLVEPEEAAR
jgi:hypothetical protein